MGEDFWDELFISHTPQLGQDPEILYEFSSNRRGAEKVATKRNMIDFLKIHFLLNLIVASSIVTGIFHAVIL